MMANPPTWGRTGVVRSRQPGFCPGRRVALAWRDARGAAAIELALTAPFVILLLMGIFDFGNLAFTMMQVEAAAHAGAQYALGTTFTSTSCAATGATSIAAAEQTATTLGTAITTTPPTGSTGVTAAAPTCGFSGCVSSGLLVSQTTTCPAGDPPGTYAVAYAQTTFTPLLSWAAFAFPSKLTATAVMRYQ
jgi:Flp pilus assembly protein TadG